MWRRPKVLMPRGTYTDWWWPDLLPGRGYRRFDHVLTPEYDPGPDATYFWAHQFRTVAGEGGYLGLQTKGNRADGSLGKMAIFSFWDTLGGEGRGVVPFSGEGTGWSCRIPYYWKAGRAYRLWVEVAEDDADVTWWRAGVADPTGDEEEIGRIRAPAAWGHLGAWSIMWTEYYGRPVARCQDLAYSNVLFSQPWADGGSVRPARSRNHLGDGGCDTSRVTPATEGVRHEMGRTDAGGE